MSGVGNFISAVAKTLAGPEAASKVSQVISEVSNGTLSSGDIIGKAAQISGFKLGQQNITAQMAKNADSATGFAKIFGAEIGDDAATTVQNVTKTIAEYGKSSEGQKDFVNKLNTAFSQDNSMFKDLSDDVIKTYKDKMSHYSGALAGNATDYAGLLGKEKGGGFSALTTGLFSDPELGKTRLGLTAGAYAGGALGIRTLSGGDLTHNARGENDIAGIPFV